MFVIVRCDSKIYKNELTYNAWLIFKKGRYLQRPILFTTFIAYITIISDEIVYTILRCNVARCRNWHGALSIPVCVRFISVKINSLKSNAIWWHTLFVSYLHGLNMYRIFKEKNSCLISSPSDERPKDSTRALTSPNDVHHSVNLSNTNFITYIYTSSYHYFAEIYVNFFVWIFLKCQFRTFSPVSFRRWTGPPIHAKQNNHTTTKNIVLILYVVTVLCHIVNMSNML